MSAETNKAFIKEYLTALSGNPKTPDLVAKYVADPELKEHTAQAERGFPNYQIVPVEMIAEGDLVSARCNITGVNTGPFQGMPATGKEINVPMSITYRIANGKIVEHWMLTDTMVMLKQLGVA